MLSAISGSNTSYLKLLRRRGRAVLSSRTTVVAIVILLPVVLGAIFGPSIAPYDVTETNLGNTFAEPSPEHPFGTDHLGRDLLSRVLIGGQTSLYIGITSTGIGLLVGVPLGIIAGYYRGWVDEMIMRAVDIMISIPGLMLALLILTVLESTTRNAILVISIVFIPRIARVIRGSALSVRQEQFITAAKIRNESDTYIIFREMLPNLLAPIIVEGSIRVGFGILLGTSLSFLGLGAQPPTPDWGFMVAESRAHLNESPWLMVWPSFALVLTIVGFNLLGDGLRDVLDPETSKTDS